MTTIQGHGIRNSSLPAGELGNCKPKDSPRLSILGFLCLEMGSGKEIFPDGAAPFQF